MQPSPGRIIQAVIPTAIGEMVTRPAIVVRTFSHADGSQQIAQATVFPDVVADGLGLMIGKSFLPYDATGQTINSWHWPQMLTDETQMKPTA